jgi:hypothetical protein
MTRLDLLKILIGQARTNGFDFRQWYTHSLRLPWKGPNAAITVLASHLHYYSLLFHHDFAQTFWKAGETITFQMPEQSFERRMPDGSIRTIHRKKFMRRSARPDAWQYHLSQMALSEEPLRYIRKYLRVEEELADEPEALSEISASAQPAIPRHATPRPAMATLAFARKAAERRERAMADLPPLPVIDPNKRRGPRLPGSR